MMAVRTILLALAVCVGATPGFADNSGLKRLTQRGDLLGWEAVGRIDLADGFCTGVLIATDLVLTAAHCLFDARTGQLRAPEQMVFRAGYRDGKAIAESQVARAASLVDYDPAEATSLANIRNDVALLQLKHSIPALTAAPFVLHEGGKAGSRVSVVSYGRGRAEALSWQKECGVLGRAQGLLVFDCDVTFGSSGAPVFVQEGGRARILSLVSAGALENSQVLSYGMELPNIVASLKNQLRSNPSARVSGSLSTNAKRITVNGGRSATGAKFVRPGGG